jgi:hypothetical protein
MPMDTNPVLPAIPATFAYAVVEGMSLAPVEDYDPRQSEEVGKREDVSQIQTRRTEARRSWGEIWFAAILSRPRHLSQRMARVSGLPCPGERCI